MRPNEVSRPVAAAAAAAFRAIIPFLQSDERLALRVAFATLSPAECLHMVVRVATSTTDRVTNHAVSARRPALTDVSTVPRAPSPQRYASTPVMQMPTLGTHWQQEALNASRPEFYDVGATLGEGDRWEGRVASLMANLGELGPTGRTDDMRRGRVGDIPNVVSGGLMVGSGAGVWEASEEEKVALRSAGRGRVV